MIPHDPAAVEVLHRQTAEAQAFLDALTAAGMAVVKVGEVPPWMERPKHLFFPDDTLVLWGDDDTTTWCSPPERSWEGLAVPLYVIREDGAS